LFLIDNFLSNPAPDLILGDVRALLISWNGPTFCVQYGHIYIFRDVIETERDVNTTISRRTHGAFAASSRRVRGISETLVHSLNVLLHRPLHRWCGRLRHAGKRREGRPIRL